jgi:hypothetical protein
MNTSGYLILIAALLVLAALMLYARFASRSREKSLHHVPDRAILPHVRAEENTLSRREEEANEPISTPPIRAERKESAPAPRPEDEYLDELQEAAAGLAMLMRSSPLEERTVPVVFAPCEEETGEEVSANADSGVGGQEASGQVDPGGQGELDAADFEESVEPVEGEEAMDSPQLAGDGDEEESASHLTILGELVCEEMSRIDVGLDDLEHLVVHIEASLADWELFDAAPEDGSAKAGEWIERAA